MAKWQTAPLLLFLIRGSCASGQQRVPQSIKDVFVSSWRGLDGHTEFINVLTTHTSVYLLSNKHKPLQRRAHKHILQQEHTLVNLCA